MRLLIIYHDGLSEGARIFYRQYVKKGIDLSVIVPSKIKVDKIFSPSGFYIYSPKDDEKGYQFFPVALRKPDSYGEGFKLFQLLKTIKRIKPDIIHVFDEYSSFYLGQAMICRNFLYSQKVPIICYGFFNLPFKSPPFIFKFSLRTLKRIFRKLLHPFLFAFHKKYIDGATGCSQEALDNIKKLEVRVPMKVIHWGIDFSLFYSQNRDLAREKLGIPKNVKLAGYFGRLVKEKGLDILVKAITVLNGYYLMLVGQGNYQEELNKMIDSLGIRKRVYFYNSQKSDQLRDYYNCLDVFVLPSQLPPFFKEQYGRVLVEAMACGLSIIGSKSGAIPEVLKGYPKHLIFEDYKVDDLIDKIKKVEKLKFPADFNLNNFLKKFSSENFVNQHINFYKNLLKHD